MASATKRRVGLAVVLMAIIAIGVYSGLRFINGGSEGVVSQAAKPARQQTADTSITVENQYASFTRPSSFISAPSDKAVAPVVANYNFVRNQLNPWQLSIQITHLETGQLTDNGTYNLRRVRTDQYRAETTTIAKQSVTIFSDKSSAAFAKVAYLQQGSVSASISLTGGSSVDNSELQAILEAVIASWHWV